MRKRFDLIVVILMGVAMFAWLLYISSLQNALKAVAVWVVLIGCTKWLHRRFGRPTSVAVVTETTWNDRGDLEESITMSQRLREYTGIDDQEFGVLLDNFESADIDEEMPRYLQIVEDKIMSAIDEGREIDEKEEYEILVELVAEEFLPDAHIRRDVIGELSKTARDPVRLWRTYTQAEREDARRFVDAIETKIRGFREHSAQIKKHFGLSSN